MLKPSEWSKLILKALKWRATKRSRSWMRGFRNRLKKVRKHLKTRTILLDLNCRNFKSNLRRNRSSLTKGKLNKGEISKRNSVKDWSRSKTNAEFNSVTNWKQSNLNPITKQPWKSNGLMPSSQKRTSFSSTKKRQCKEKLTIENSDSILK